MTAPNRNGLLDSLRARIARQKPRQQDRQTGRTSPLDVQDLEDRTLLAADPVVTLDLPGEVFLGEEFTFTATFDNQPDGNAGSDTGYGPYIDLIVPVTGTDGAGGQIDDGIDFVGATYLGSPLQVTQVTFDAAGEAEHPLIMDGSGNPTVITGTPGDKLVVLQLPFGSVTGPQPEITAQITAVLSNLADLDQPLTIGSGGGFQFGLDPAVSAQNGDPTVVADAGSAQLSPKLFELTKEYLGPEDETATGPNYLRQYRLTIDIADGQTLTEFDLTDRLDNNVVYRGFTVVSGGPNDAGDTTEPASTSQPLNNSELVVNFNSVTGTAAADDVVIRVDFYVPEFDADGNRVIPIDGEDEANGNESITENNAAASGLWDTIDGRDPNTVVTADPVGVEHTLDDKSLAVQKGVSVVTDTGFAGPTPGDTLEYVLNFQISDYYTFAGLTLTDTYQDGQIFDSGFTPTITVGDAFGGSAGAFLASEFTLIDDDDSGADAIDNGQQRLIFDIDEFMIRTQTDDILQGGRSFQNDPDGAPGTGNGPATGQIRFRTVIQEDFEDDFPSGDPSVDQGDIITNNNVVIDGEVRRNAEDGSILTPLLTSETDGTSAQVRIVAGELTKQLYAVNGSTANVGDNLTRGDTVTYRIGYMLPTTDFEDLLITDFLPLPVLVASDPDGDGSAGPNFTFNSTPISAATPPAAGQAQIGPDDTFFSRSLVLGNPRSPAVSVVGGNGLQFDYGEFDDPQSTETQIDILFTVTVNDEVFEDGIFLTNIARATADTTNAGNFVADSIVMIQLEAPALEITKGVVATNGNGTISGADPGGNVTWAAAGTGGAAFSGGPIGSNDLSGADAIDSDVANVDAGDLVRFAVVIENTGAGDKGAFDVTLSDAPPTGFNPASEQNFRVTNGAGTVIGFTRPDGSAATAADFFAGGIELIDDNADDGAIDQADPADGTNVVVITFDLTANANIQPTQSGANIATLSSYANANDGPNYIPAGLVDSANVSVRNANVLKEIVATDQAHTAGNNVVVGEIVTYRTTVTVPEGQSLDVTLRDTLDAGLAFVGFDSITASPGLSTSRGTFNDVLSGVVVSGVGAAGTPSTAGRRATFDFGTVTNANNDGAAETIVVTYRAVVLDVTENGVGRSNLDNLARWQFGSPNNAGFTSVSDDAPDLTVQGPDVRVTKSRTTADEVDAADTVSFDIIVNNRGNADAFDVDFTDTLPDGLTFASFSGGSGTAPSTPFQHSGGVITARWDQLDNGATFTVTVNVTIDADVDADTTITNTARADFTSIDDGDDNGSVQRSPFNPNSTERIGSGVGTAQVNIAIPTIVKSFVTTSDPSTAADEHAAALPDVAIGETITFDLTVTLPEGRTDDLIIEDLLPRSGTADFAELVSAQIQSIGSNLGGGNGNLTVGQGPTASFNDNNAGGADRYRFTLGDVTNSGADAASAAADQVVVRVTVRNTDVPANADGVVRTNTGRIVWAVDTDNDGTADETAQRDATSRYDIVEPALQLMKVADPASGDAGDTIEYTLTLSHTGASTSDAFDLNLTDLLTDPNLTLDAGTVTAGTTGGGTATITEGNGGGDDEVRVTLDRLEQGQTLTVTFMATIGGGASPGGDVDNSGAATFDSLPGQDAVDRDGSVNANQSVDVDQTTGIKAIVSTSEADSAGNDVLIGEVVRYSLTVSVPEGTSNNFQVRDNLPGAAGGGLRFLNDGTVTVAYSDGDITGPANATITDEGGDGSFGDGEDVIFDLSPIVNGANNDGDAETVTISFNAVVVNGAGNNAGSVLTNSFDTTIDGIAQNTSNTLDVTVREPAVGNFDKRVVGYTGDTTTFEIAFGNTGSAPAYDLSVADALPAGMTLQTGSVVVTTPGSFTDGSDAADLDITIDRLAPGETVTVRYTVDVVNATAKTNAASLTYSSLPGDNGTGDATPGAPGSATGERTGNGAGANDLAAADAVVLGSIGDFVWYDIDGAGTQPGDPGIGGVTVNLRGAGANGILGDGDDVLTDTVTDGNGAYLFTGLPDGAYRVTVDAATLPTGLTTATFDLDSGTAGPDGTTLVSLAAGNRVRGDADFGYTGAGAIGDTVFYDHDLNQTQNDGEFGIAGAEVTLVWFGRNGAEGDGDDVTYAIDTTDGSGAYLFERLPAGNFRVSVDGGTIDWDGDGADDAATATTATVFTPTLAAGQTDLTRDFGFVGPLVVGDLIYRDRNGDGAFNGTDVGLPGQIVRLEWDLDGDGNVEFTRDAPATGQDGAYLFENLPTGQYTVTVLNPPDNSVNTEDPDSPGAAPDNGDSTSTFDLTADDLARDFGYAGQAAGNIGDFVWLDRDGDGVQDANEPGLAGVQVFLDYDADGNGTIETTDETLTDQNGGYSFTDLPAGTYTVRVVQPGGTTQTFDSTAPTNDNQSTVVLTAADPSSDTQDFGYVGSGIVGDLVWYDFNGDGVQQMNVAGTPNEPGAPGLTVTLDVDRDGNGVFETQFTTVTGGDGSYQFTGLPDGDYRVSTALPTGTVPISEPDGNPDGVLLTTLTSPSANTDATRDFGLTGSGSIGDFVFHDVNANGAFDAGTDRPIGGVDLTLVWNGPDGNPGGGDDSTFTTTTAPDGSYSFGNLPAGQYTVMLDQSTLPGGITTGTFDRDGNDDGVTPVTLAAGNLDQDGVDFGYTGSGAIGDTVFYDYDGNQTQNAGEFGIAGVDLTLTWFGINGVEGDGDDLTFTDTTDANGNYGFDNLPAGTFRVTVNGGSIDWDDDGTDDPANATTATDFTTTLATGGVDNANDFGFQGPLVVGDLVYRDRDGDGAFNNTDVGLPGAIVRLDFDLDGDGATELSRTMTTGQMGEYLFENLPNGQYTVTVTNPPANAVNTEDPDSPGASPDAGDSTSTFTLVADDPGRDFGYDGDGVGVIGDLVWLDLDGDGTLDAGEPGLAGVQVFLDYDANGDGIIETTDSQLTGQDGSYSFNGRPEGTYTVRVVTPAGTSQTFDATAPTDDGMSTVVLDAANPASLEQDFAYVGDGVVGDLVFHDFNGDGVQQLNVAGTPDEPGVVGAEVRLEIDRDRNGVFEAELNTVTGADGAYRFENLPDGAYRVTVTSKPTGLTQVSDPDGSLDETATADLAGAEDQDLTRDFGYVGGGRIGDFLWYDADGDGAYDANADRPLPGVRLFLDWNGQDGDAATAGDNVRFEAVTAADGSYVFEQLPTGDYTVTVDRGTLPAGVTVDTFDRDGDNDGVVTTTLAVGPTFEQLDVDFAFTATGAVGDTVFNDVDGNALQSADPNGEPGIENVPVTLLWAGFDGVFGTADDLSRMTITAADGQYGFGMLAAGEYRVEIRTTGIDTDGDGNLDAVNATTANPVELTLPIGGMNPDADFGINGDGAIGDQIFLDRDGDGVFEPDQGDTGLPGVGLRLDFDTDGDGTVDYFLTVTTDQNGMYRIGSLLSANYVTTVLTPPELADLTFDPDGTLDGTADVSLDSGESNLRQDYGYQGRGRLGNFVWYDLNADGVQDAGEPGIPGLRVSLLSDYNRDGMVDFAESVLTDQNGQYTFGTLPAGDYRIVVGAPDGYVATFDADGIATTGVSETSLSAAMPMDFDQDFGFVGTGRIDSEVFFDQDGDGVRGPDEGPLPGVEITYEVDLNGDGTTDYTAATTTGPDGGYSFDNLLPGTYTIVAGPNGLPDDAVFLSDRDGTPDGRTVLTLGPGETVDDAFFGVGGTGVVGDLVFKDRNFSGAFDAGDEGFGGVDVTLRFAGPDGILDTPDDTVRTVTTVPDGGYLFSNLLAGTYRVNIDPADVAGEGVQSADPDGGMDNMSVVVIAGGEENRAQDFGYGATGVVGDLVWFDVNGDGVRQPGENGLAGVRLDLRWAGTDNVFGTADDLTRSAVTDAAGMYRIGMLPPGTYEVAVATQTLPAGVRPTFDLDGGADGRTFFTLGVNEERFDVDFGYTGTGSVAGSVFIDANRNGVRDPGEGGIGGATVILEGADDRGNPVRFERTTAADGGFAFGDLRPGQYTLIELQPERYVDGSENAGAGGTVAGDDRIVVNLGPDQQVAGFTFGELGLRPEFASKRGLLGSSF